MKLRYILMHHWDIYILILVKNGPTIENRILKKKNYNSNRIYFKRTKVD